MCAWLGLAVRCAGPRLVSGLRVADVNFFRGVVHPAQQWPDKPLKTGGSAPALGGEIAPFSSVLLRTESAASSNIENLTASARAIAEAETLGNTKRRNASMI